MPQGDDAELGVLYRCPPGFYSETSPAALEMLALCFSARGAHGGSWVWPGGSHGLCKGSALQPPTGELWPLPALGDGDRCCGGEQGWPGGRRPLPWGTPSKKCPVHGLCARGSPC